MPRIANWTGWPTLATNQPRGSLYSLQDLRVLVITLYAYVLEEFDLVN
jgi:hypothetical protein